MRKIVPECRGGSIKTFICGDKMSSWFGKNSGIQARTKPTPAGPIPKNNILNVWGSTTRKIFKNENQNLEFNSFHDRKPMQFLKIRRGMIIFRRIKNKFSGAILKALKTINFLFGSAIQKWVWIVEPGSDECANSMMTCYIINEYPNTG